MTADGYLFLTDEHKMIRQAARDFAEKEIAPVAAEYDESGELYHFRAHPQPIGSRAIMTASKQNSAEGTYDR